MPVPFASAATLREFVARATNDFGCELKTTKEPTRGPRGEVHFPYLKKGDRIAQLPDIDDDDLLRPGVLRSLCAQLDIPLEKMLDTLTNSSASKP